MHALLIFAKYPEPDKVKTRLARRLGAHKAALVYQKMVEQVLIETKPGHFQFDRVLYFDPPEREAEFKQWLPEIKLWHTQAGQGLGERLAHAIQDSLKKYERVAVIGTDCVDVHAVLIQEAFELLDQSDLVLGPAQDGGYYLLACRHFYAELFQNIAWSTERVLTQTLAKAAQLKLAVAQLQVLADLDE